MSAVHVSSQEVPLTIYVSALPLDVAITAYLLNNIAALIAGFTEPIGDTFP